MSGSVPGWRAIAAASASRRTTAGEPPGSTRRLAATSERVTRTGARASRRTRASRAAGSGQWGFAACRLLPAACYLPVGRIRRVVHGRRVPLVEHLPPLGVGQEEQPADPGARVGQGGGQQGAEVPGQPLDGGGVEQV